MPKFKVYVQQYVEEQSVLYIEAANVEEALEQAEQDLADGNVCWTPGDDMIRREVYSIYNEEGDEEVWNRL